MKKKVVIIGASGHGKVIADIIIKSGDSIIGFLDDNKKINELFCGFPILGKCVDYKKRMNDCEFVIAIGDANIRERIAKELCDVKWYTAIHPHSTISSIDVSIGEGTVVMANAVINSGAKIGKHCIINTNSVVEHDNLIDDFVHVSVGVNIAGNVHVGRKTWVGIGAIIKNNVEVCDNCMIGAGAVVIKNICEVGTYIGVPVRKI